MNLRRPIDPYDRKISSPAMHYHLPVPHPVGSDDPQRLRGRGKGQQQTTYLQQLMGRRSRSHSRSGMKVLVEKLRDFSKPTYFGSLISPLHFQNQKNAQAWQQPEAINLMYYLGDSLLYVYVA